MKINEVNMKIESADRKHWINERHIIVYYIDDDYNGVLCKTIDGGIYPILSMYDTGYVSMDILTSTIRIISAKALNQVYLSQYELWKELKKQM